MYDIAELIGCYAKLVCQHFYHHLFLAIIKMQITIGNGRKYFFEFFFFFFPGYGSVNLQSFHIVGLGLNIPHKPESEKVFLFLVAQRLDYWRRI